MLFYKQEIGKIGEKAAAKYLRRKHYKILKQNFSNAFGEIDIIAKNSEYIVFVEVKTRTSIDFGYPAQAVDWKKQKKIITVAQTYLKNAYTTNMRFDIMEVYLDKETRTVQKIQHIENAFGA